jgi:hypothetical protein
VRINEASVSDLSGLCALTMFLYFLHFMKLLSEKCLEMFSYNTRIKLNVLFLNQSTKNKSGLQ